jgi:hypothetical protein
MYVRLQAALSSAEEAASFPWSEDAPPSGNGLAWR